MDGDRMPRFYALFGLISVVSIAVTPAFAVSDLAFALESPAALEWYAEGDGDSDRAVISDDGRYLAYSSRVRNAIPDSYDIPADFDRAILVSDLTTGETLPVSVTGDGRVVRSAGHPSISADGRFVAFESYSTRLVTNDQPGDGRVRARSTDRPDGARESDQRRRSGSAGWRQLRRANQRRWSLYRVFLKC